MKDFPSFQLQICMKPDFLHILQPKQHYHDRLNAEADKRTQLSIFSHTSEICTSVKQCHLSQFLFWKIFFCKNFVLPIVGLFLNELNILNFLSLYPNTVNIGSYNPHKQKLFQILNF